MAPRSEARNRRVPRVLLVEDDEWLRSTIVDMLAERAYAVRALPLAEQGLALFSEPRPDIILLDLGMPPGEMTGTEFLHRLRENRNWMNVPVIIVSGVGDVLNPDLVAAMRVSAVLQKPFDAELLFQTIAAVI